VTETVETTAEETKTDRAALAAFKKQLRDDGFCGRCYQRDAEPGKSLCEVCRPKVNAERQKQRKEKRKAGLCRTCLKEPRKKGFANCQGCIDTERVRIRKAMRKLRKKRKKETGYANPPKDQPKEPQ
jgi:hypothetical protein